MPLGLLHAASLGTPPPPSATYVPGARYFIPGIQYAENARTSGNVSTDGIIITFGLTAVARHDVTWWGSIDL